MYRSTGILAVCILAIACTPFPVDTPRDVPQWTEVLLELDRTKVLASVPKSSPEFPRNIEVDSGSLKNSSYGQEKGAWFPVIANFDSGHSESGMKANFSVRLGVDMVEGKNLLSRGPEAGVAELESDWWDFGNSESARRAEELHRRNEHIFEVHVTSQTTWERHFSEGILDSVYDLYRTPITQDIYLNIVFVYDRQRWKSDKEWFNDRLAISRQVLESVSIARD